MDSNSTFASGNVKSIDPEKSLFKGGEQLRDQGGSPSLAAGVCSPPNARPIGLVGPMSNYVAPPQLVENVPYRDLHEMHAFARKWREEHRGKWFTAHKLSGFCLLMKRDVYEKIGGLDERFGMGFFDDDDLAERARRAGFDLAVAQDLFVHHFGSRTFQRNGVDAEKLLEKNARRLADKWGLKTAGGEMVALKPWRAADSSPFLSEAQRAFARQVDEPGHSRPPTRATSSPTRIASEGSNANRSDSEEHSIFAGNPQMPGSSNIALAGQEHSTGTLAGQEHSTGTLAGQEHSTGTLAGQEHSTGTLAGQEYSTGTLASAF